MDTIKVLCCEGSFNKRSIENVDPNEFALFQNYPNPFNPSTKIAFNLPEETIGKLSIYDITGKKVTTLIEGKMKKGYTEINWEPINLSSGIYFYKLEAGTFSEEKKMIFIK